METREEIMEHEMKWGKIVKKNKGLKKVLILY